MAAHLEYIDDMLIQLKPDEVHLWLPLLEQALATVGSRLNRSKSKVWVPSCPVAEYHAGLFAMGLVQVFDGLEIMGGAMDGQHAAVIVPRDTSVPCACLKRIAHAENLAATIAVLLRTPLSRPARRAAWTLLDKVLNRALDYDARILHPESFSNLATRLDRSVRDTAVKIVDVRDLDYNAEACVRLAAKYGGGDITAAGLKKNSFTWVHVYNTFQQWQNFSLVSDIRGCR